MGTTFLSRKNLVRPTSPTCVIRGLPLRDIGSPAMKTEASVNALSGGAPPYTGRLDDYLSPEEQAEELEVSERTLARWRSMRTGPRYTTVGRKILYRRRWTAEWLERDSEI